MQRRQKLEWQADGTNGAGLLCPDHSPILSLSRPNTQFYLHTCSGQHLLLQANVQMLNRLALHVLQGLLKALQSAPQVIHLVRLKVGGAGGGVGPSRGGASATTCTGAAVDCRLHPARALRLNSPRALTLQPWAEELVLKSSSWRGLAAWGLWHQDLFAAHLARKRHRFTRGGSQRRWLRGESVCHFLSGRKTCAGGGHLRASGETQL